MLILSGIGTGSGLHRAHESASMSSALWCQHPHNCRLLENRTVGYRPVSNILGQPVQRQLESVKTCRCVGIFDAATFGSTFVKICRSSNIVQWVTSSTDSPILGTKTCLLAPALTNKCPTLTLGGYIAFPRTVDLILLKTVAQECCTVGLDAMGPVTASFSFRGLIDSRHY